jgi:hypothetical protein
LEEFFHISLGNILTIITFLVGGLGFAYTVRNDVRIATLRIEAMEEDVHELRKTIVELARQEERMRSLDQRLLAQGVRLDQVVNRLDGVLNRERDLERRMNGNTRQKKEGS